MHLSVACGARSSTQLSGGERRRAEIALAWIRAPRCLLADEPFARIDPADRELIAQVFRELAENGCALVIAGHEVRQLLEIADNVVWLGVAALNWLHRSALLGGIYSRPVVFTNAILYFVAALVLLKAASRLPDATGLWVLGDDHDVDVESGR